LKVSDTPIFSILTAPRLEYLSIWRIRWRIDAITPEIQSFISRSSCSVKRLYFQLHADLPTHSLRVFLDLFDAAEAVKVLISTLGLFLGPLQDSNVLPRLKRLDLVYVRASEDEYNLLLEILRSRHNLAGRDGIQSLELTIARVLPPSIMAQLRALADSGMNVRVFKGHELVMDSDERGL
jgi:hypothetical protein